MFSWWAYKTPLMNIKQIQTALHIHFHMMPLKVQIESSSNISGFLTKSGQYVDTVEKAPELPHAIVLLMSS